MEVAYRVKMMPSAEEAYFSLRLQTQRLTSPSPSSSPLSNSKLQHFNRVNEILCSIQNPLDIQLDQMTLGITCVRSRSIGSTLVYFQRWEIPVRRVSVLVITECDSTNSYARFCAFMNAGGYKVFEALGLHLPIGSIGSSGMLQ
jgi:hypothetical protein